MSQRVFRPTSQTKAELLKVLADLTRLVKADDLQEGRLSVNLAAQGDDKGTYRRVMVMYQPVSAGLTGKGHVEIGEWQDVLAPGEVPASEAEPGPEASAGDKPTAKKTTTTKRKGK